MMNMAAIQIRAKNIVASGPKRPHGVHHMARSRGRPEGVKLRRLVPNATTSQSQSMNSRASGLRLRYFGWTMGLQKDNCKRKATAYATDSLLKGEG
jgi:hypothetical protein